MAPHRSLCLAVISVVLAACGAAAQPSGAGSGGAAVPGRAYDPICNFKPSAAHAYSSVIWFWFGDSDASNVASNSAVTPYTGALMDRCGIAVDYHNITHPYLPNELGATSGVVQGPAATTDCAPAACPQPQQSIFDQLQAGGRQWREFVLAPQGTCADGPAAFYPSVAARCAQWEAPLGTPQSGELRDELVGGTLADFTFILPDIAHDTGPQSDQLLSQWIPAITGSSQYKAGKVAVFITWDQGLTSPATGESCDDHTHANSVLYPGCNVAFIALAPSVGQTRSTDYFTHYSLLRTTEEMLGISSYLGGAAQAQSMRSALHL